MQRLADKYPQHKFTSKQSVLNYMTKALSYELRQSSKVNNEAFRFKDNSTLGMQEKYLQYVENNLAKDLNSQLRRKIAGVFPREIAYALLCNSNFNLKENDQFVINTQSTVDLSSRQNLILLDQVKAIYGNKIKEVFIVSKDQEVKASQKITNKTPFTNSLTIAKSSGALPATTPTQERQANSQFTPTPLETNSTCSLSVTKDDNSVWSRVSNNLIAYFGESIYQAWFSKLEPEEDSDKKIMNFKAPNNLISSWVQNNYRTMLRVFCEQENYRLGEFI
jgi:hypothetical protein